MISVIALNKDGKYYVHNGTHLPKRPVCKAPLVDGKKAKSWHFDKGILEVVDRADPENIGQIIKIAVVHEDKLLAHIKELAYKAALVEKSKSERLSAINKLKDIGSDDVKKLMEILGL